MKEFALKHPLLTFILVDITAYNIFNVINNCLRLRAAKLCAKEETPNEKDFSNRYTVSSNSSSIGSTDEVFRQRN